MAQRFASVLVLALACLVPCGAASAQGVPPPAAAMKVGVVDLGLVFKQYKKSADLEERINLDRERLRGDLDQQKKAISELIKVMELLDPDSDTYRVKEDEKDAAVAKFDRTKKRLEETLKKTWERYNLELLDDIEKIVKAHGEEQHFTFILKVDGKQTEEQRMLVGLKAVLYSSRELDITPTIVEMLNRNYEISKVPGGSAPKGGVTQIPNPAPGAGGPAVKTSAPGNPAPGAGK